MKSKIIAVIMGGGRGTRLHPLTLERCKPAVPLAGKYRLVDIPISNCLHSGMNQIYVLSQFNTASLHRHIQEAYKFDPFGGGFVDILSAEQTATGSNWYQGTADAVRQNLHHFDADDDDLVMILSGDQLYQMDLRAMEGQHRSTGSDITIAAKAMKVSEVQGLGLMRITDDLNVTEFVEKPTDPEVIRSLAVSEAIEKQLPDGGEEPHVLASMGIYCFNFGVLRKALDNSYTDFGKEVIPKLLNKLKMKSFVFSGYWEDIGTVHSFFEANLGLTATVPPFNFFDCGNPVYTRARYLPPSKINGSTFHKAILADGTIISDSNMTRCVFGVRSVVEEGCEFENVVMMGADYFEDSSDRIDNEAKGRPHVGVGKNCVIKNAIIDKNARIGNNVKLSPDGKPDMYQEGSLFVRDGVLVVLKNGIVPDGTVF